MGGPPVGPRRPSDRGRRVRPTTVIRGPQDSARTRAPVWMTHPEPSSTAGQHSSRAVVRRGRGSHGRRAASRPRVPEIRLAGPCLVLLDETQSTPWFRFGARTGIRRRRDRRQGPHDPINPRHRRYRGPHPPATSRQPPGRGRHGIYRLIAPQPGSLSLCLCRFGAAPAHLRSRPGRS